MGKIPVAILGATGAVGQKLSLLLENHPYFEIHELVASEKSSGIEYGKIKWFQNKEIPQSLYHKKIKSLEDGIESLLCFSALDAAIASIWEMKLADLGHWVVTNTKSFRMHPDVPLIVPEVNWSTWKKVKKRWKQGGILANPNCCCIGLALSLFPLQEKFGLEALKIVTLQAISGAGYPGVASLDIFDNVIPHISDEIEKIEEEIPKIFGMDSDALRISAQVNRVPVLDGHMLVISAKLKREATSKELETAWSAFVPKLSHDDLPSRPKELFFLEKSPFFPQPRLHRDRENGMAITIGPIKPCSVLDWKFTSLVHNTVRGAAGGTLLIAEALYKEGVFSQNAKEIDPESICIAKSTCS